MSRRSASMYQVTTFAQREVIRQCRRHGWSPERISIEAKAQGFDGITIDVVEDVLEEVVRVKVQPKRREIEPARKAAIIAAIESGDTVLAVAKRFKVAPSSVCAWTRGVAGKNPPGRRAPDPETVDAVVAAYVRGVPTVQITAEFGINSATIYGYLTRRGVVNNRRPHNRTLGRAA